MGLSPFRRKPLVYVLKIHQPEARARKALPLGPSLALWVNEYAWNL